MKLLLLMGICWMYPISGQTLTSPAERTLLQGGFCVGRPTPRTAWTFGVCELLEFAQIPVPLCIYIIYSVQCVFICHNHVLFNFTLNQITSLSKNHHFIHLRLYETCSFLGYVSISNGPLSLGIPEKPEKNNALNSSWGIMVICPDLLFWCWSYVFGDPCVCFCFHFHKAIRKRGVLDWALWKH